MKIKLNYVIIVLSINFLSCGKKTLITPFNKSLIMELEAIYKDDQLVRGVDVDDLKYNNLSNYRDSLNHTYGFGLHSDSTKLWELQEKKDSLNAKKIKNILELYGYPGLRTVGSPYNTYVWYVMMHQKKDKLNDYLLIVKKATKKGELEKKFYCQMIDRVMMYNHKEQIYGTQGYGFINFKDQKEEFTQVIWPIKNAKNVNELRRKVGFDETIEVYCKKLLGTDYKKYTIKEIEEIENNNKYNDSNLK